MDVQKVGVLGLLLPEVRSKIAVGVADGNESGLQGVLNGTGGTSGRGESILDTGELQESLDGGGCNDALTARSRDEADEDGTALTGDLGGQSVRLTDLGTPVTTTNGDNAELSDVDGSTNGRSDFLGGLDTETYVTVTVTDKDNSTETSTLTSTGLLLDGLDLHDLVLEVRKEVVDDLELGDTKRALEDLLEVLNLASLHETTELGDGLPAAGLLVATAAATTTTTATTTATATESTSALSTVTVTVTVFSHY